MKLNEQRYTPVQELGIRVLCRLYQANEAAGEDLDRTWAHHAFPASWAELRRFTDKNERPLACDHREEWARTLFVDAAAGIHRCASTVKQWAKVRGEGVGPALASYYRDIARYLPTQAGVPRVTGSAPMPGVTILPTPRVISRASGQLFSEVRRDAYRYIAFTAGLAVYRQAREAFDLTDLDRRNLDRYRAASSRAVRGMGQ